MMSNGEWRMDNGKWIIDNEKHQAGLEALAGERAPSTG
jgi:hypothetical protein